MERISVIVMSSARKQVIKMQNKTIKLNTAKMMKTLRSLLFLSKALIFCFILFLSSSDLFMN